MATPNLLPVVLLHGFGNDHTLWKPQLPLASRFRLIAPDLRGFGADQATDGAPITMDAYADNVVALLDRLEVARAVVGGISLGGYVAMSVALRYPDRTAGLVLANTRAIGDNEAQRKSRDAMAEDIEKRGALAVVEAFGDRPLRPDASPETRAELRAMILRQPPASLRSATLGMRDRPDRTPRLGSIRAPALVITGTADVFIPPSDSEAIHRAMPGSTFVNIPGAGHLSNLDSPDEFNAALEPFLARIAK